MTPTDMLTFDGITQPVREWAMDYGIVPAVILGRLERGMTTEAAITLPMVVAKGQKLPAYAVSLLPFDRARRNAKRASDPSLIRIAHDGLSLTIAEWAERTGIDADLIRSRMRLGWPAGHVVTEPVRARRRPKGPGVPSDLGPFVGTGAGSTARETPNITFPEKAEA